MASAFIVHNPFDPAGSRQSVDVAPGAPIASLALTDARPFIILRNSVPVLRAGWSEPILPGDLLHVVVLPRGGGEGGSNPLKIVLMIVVIIIAIYTGQWWALNMAQYAWMAPAIQAAIVIGGGMLVNAMVPTPTATTAELTSDMAAPSPTYNLQAQGNYARLGAAIPVQYGRMRAYPDYAAHPYIEYAGNEQYLYCLLCLGWGEYDIEAIRIEDTPIANFEEITYEVIGPGSSPTLFPVNVVSAPEVSGQELASRVSGTYAQAGTTVTVTKSAHGFQAGASVYLDFTSGSAVDGSFTVATADANTFTVTAGGSLTTSGNVDIQSYIGGFVSSGASTTANALGLDVVMPRGLYRVDEGGVFHSMSITVRAEARTLDNNGDPTSAWATLGTETFTLKTTTPRRESLRYSVTAARYEVRLVRTDVKDAGTDCGHDILWTGLRAYLTSAEDFGNVTLLALRMRASNNLSTMASRKVNVLCTRKLPAWNGSTWTSAEATSSIAWALADACRNTDYSVGLPDSRIDLAALLALEATWSGRGDTFSARFDSALTLWEALTKIAGAGRARPYLQGGTVRFVRDGAQTTPAAVFTHRNIRKGSFSVQYLLPSEETADAVDVSYYDASTGWSEQVVRCTLPGGTENQPVKIDLFGVTDRAQAYREGIYHAASNRYRRRVISFSTEMDGFIPTLGDLIAVSHDMPQWGQASEVTAWNAETGLLTLSEPMTFGVGDHYIGLRKSDGSLSGPWAVTAGGADNELIVSGSLDFTPYTGGSQDRTQCLFGPGETWRQPALVVGVRPRGLYEVEIECINEDPSVHTAESGLVAPAVRYSQLPAYYTAPVVASLTMRSSPLDSDKVLLTWSPAPGAETYHIEMASGDDPYDADLAWTRVGETAASNYAVTALYGAATLVRVRGVGLAVGPWTSLYFGSNSDFMWGSESALMWDANDATLMWG